MPAIEKTEILFPLAGEPEPRLAIAPLWMVSACLLSVALYMVSVSQLRFPYSVGIYQRMVEIKTRHFLSSQSPRLIILAGSNARVSHRARILEQELGLPVTNGGLSAAVSTAFVLEAFERHLAPGDFVYLPLEYEPLLSRDRGSQKDYFYMIAYDRDLLRRLPWREQIRAWFSFDLTHFFASPAEMAITRFLSVTSSREEIDAWGDQANHPDAVPEALRRRIMSMELPPLPNASALEARPAMLVALEGFLDRCRKRDIHVIGGLPTLFNDLTVDPHLIECLRITYESRGHRFLSLPNRSQYPRAQFYDSKYHLRESAAREHSMIIAEHIRDYLAQ